MRREGEENIEINWDAFDAIDRHQASAEHLKKVCILFFLQNERKPNVRILHVGLF